MWRSLFAVAQFDRLIRCQKSCQIVVVVTATAVVDADVDAETAKSNHHFKNCIYWDPWQYEITKTRPTNSLSISLSLSLSLFLSLFLSLSLSLSLSVEQHTPTLYLSSFCSLCLSNSYSVYYLPFSQCRILRSMPISFLNHCPFLLSSFLSVPISLHFYLCFVSRLRRIEWAGVLKLLRV